MGFPTDDELLFFSYNRITDFDEPEARRWLAGPNADLYRNHLLIARFIDGWTERLGEARPDGSDADQEFKRGLWEIAAHLRQGDFLPGGVFYEQEIGDEGS